jgi:hypothetical protein
MAQLINKGGFRERANRSRKYKQSENEITNLPPTISTSEQRTTNTRQKELNKSKKYKK